MVMALQQELFDPLTGIYSRQTLKTRLQEEANRALRYDQPFTILLLDLDHFKSVNDAFGHSRGDAVLAQLAQRLAEASRRSDIVFRYGGDEFIVLLPNTGKEAGVAIGARVLAALHEAPYEGAPPITLSASMGIASFPLDADTPESLFNVADRRHYAAKRSGRGVLVSEDEGAPAGLGFEHISRAIERDRALEKAHTFLDQLPRHHQGALEVTGAAGSGKTRMLEEIAKIARLMGYLVLPVAGKPALKMRLFGALLEAEEHWGGLPSITEGENKFCQAAAQLAADKGNVGILFTVDDLAELDRQSLALLERVFYNPILPPVALAFSNLTERRGQYLTDAPWLDTIQLAPFTPDGMRIWLRHILQWEPKPDFCQWLYEPTEGYPGALKRALTILVSEGILTPKGDAWRLKEDTGKGHFSAFPLRFWLAQEQRGPKSSLPASASSFVGRTREIRQVKGLLQTNQLINLLGPGGIGKSRLAVQIAAESLERFRDGAYFVPLATINVSGFENSLTPLIAAIADTVGASLTGQAEIKKQLIEFLRGKTILLVLDSYEHLLSTSSFLAELLEQAPRARILVTSRERTNLHAETVVEISGLPVASDDGWSARHFESVQLFVHSAVRVDAGFVLEENNLRYVNQICRVVGGMPLGIELAAAWVGMFTCEQIAEQIGRNFNHLADTRQDGSSHYRNLLAVFDYFWNLLSPAEQIILSRLSTFRGQFNGAAAAEVAGASPFFLGALVNRVFLTRAADGYFHMHDLLRQYAAEKLAATPNEGERASTAHAGFYLSFLHERTMHLRGKRQTAARLEIAANIENIHAAWNWAVEQFQYEALTRALEALELYFDIQGRYREGSTLFGFSAAVLEERSTPDDRARPEFRRLYAKIRMRYASFHHMLGFYHEANEIIQACLPVARQFNDRRELAFILENLGWNYREMGEPYPKVKAAWEESLALYRELQIPWGIAQVLYDLSFIAPLEEMQTLMEEKLDICVEIGDEAGIADTLLSLGDIAEQRGEYEAGINHLMRSVQIYQSLDNTDGLGFAHYGLGKIAHARGEYQTAQDTFQKSLTLFRQGGNVNGMSNALARACRAAIALGKFDEARAGLENSLALERQTGSKIGIAYALNTLGELAFEEAQYEQARELLEESHTILAAAADTWGLSRTLTNLSRLAAHNSNAPAALEHARAALQLANKLGETLFIHNSTLALAAACRLAGELDTAKTHLRDALRQAAARNSPPLIIASLLEAARLYRQASQPAQAAPLLHLIAHHPASTFNDQQAARALLAGAPVPSAPADLHELAQSLLDSGLDG
jgi:diguanylate cyclase (GGDEF)-like protein